MPVASNQTPQALDNGLASKHSLLFHHQGLQKSALELCSVVLAGFLEDGGRAQGQTPCECHRPHCSMGNMKLVQLKKTCSQFEKFPFTQQLCEEVKQWRPEYRVVIYAVVQRVQSKTGDLPF